jgi:C-3',4' desaturase CrtD
MPFEVVVVGAGIGGLTTAALLAARGLSVCLLERGPEGGGCAATLEIAGHRFERGSGLYASWEPGGIHERIFSELAVSPPEVRQVYPSYVVRLPDSVEVRVTPDVEEFEDEIRKAFPECDAAAVDFYRDVLQIAKALERAARRSPQLVSLSKLQRLKLAAFEPRLASHILAGTEKTTAQHLRATSPRFRRFIDAQLQTLAQTTSDNCAYLYAAVVLAQPLQGIYAMRGGAQSLVTAMVQSIKESGGVVRFNAPVLRLSFDTMGHARGVDLLSGETVEATRAIVSNLTIWDTYGKLVSLSRTPADVAALLRSSTAWGAYQLYLSSDEGAVARLPCERIMLLSAWQDGIEFDPETAVSMISVAPEWDPRAPKGKRATTLSTFTRAEQWFSFHEDETAHEADDQRTLEERWAKLHRQVPELGDGIEIIETATPRTFYEETRRKLGMVGNALHRDGRAGSSWATHRTSLPNLFMTGDTVFPGNGVAAVTHSALIVADEIA